MAKKKAGVKKQKAGRRDAKPRAGRSSSGKKIAASDAPQVLKPTRFEQGDPEKKPFTPKTLDRTVIAIPLLNMLDEEKRELEDDPRRDRRIFRVIIDINLEYPRGREGARDWVRSTTQEILGEIARKRDVSRQGINETKSEFSPQYLFAVLEGDVIRELVRRDTTVPKEEPENQTIGATIGPRAIYHIWPDFEIRSLINRSISTVKADAAQTAFAASGEGVVWAVLDSGIQGDHPHFEMHKNLELKRPLIHKDFTALDSKGVNPLKDEFGHGTHVAGIIAGAWRPPEEENKGEAKPGKKKRTEMLAYTRQRDEHGEVSYNKVNLTSISGMAPMCKLLSLKVLDENGFGLASNLIAAIAMIQDINGHGRRLLIHGVNMSVGYDFEPEWFACGQSPLCVEVDRLVRSGVVVVVAAGNTGFGSSGGSSAGADVTINDPGNAELAITVGSTHKDMPHIYGVSYFSSKGPTGDGRPKPDLVAPGEKIISCAAGEMREKMKEKAGDCEYVEDSGTSMAAPHVSGVIAAFLSIRREFIGKPEKVKDIFLSTATDLNRERYFQGHGLVDLMRAIQSV